MANVMVINMGMKSIRCIIFSSRGVKLGSAALPITTAINGNCVEQNPDEWAAKSKKVMQKACLDAGRSRVDFVTVTASASCLICVDKDGVPLRNALMVSDKRAVRESEYIGGLPGFAQVSRDTGLAMSAGLMLPKILWVRNNETGIYEKTAKFLSPNDYLVYILTGKFITDSYNAAKFHYDSTGQGFPKAVLEKLGIPEKCFPEVAESGTEVGTILKDMAENTGVSRDARVVLSSYDAICSFIGSGASEEGEASDVSGTVTVFRAYTKKTISRDSGKIYSVPFYGENAHIVGGSNNLGGGLIEWVKQCYYANDRYPYEIMEKDAGESEIGARGLVFLPYLLGERTPIWDDDARGVFFGLERMHTRKDMTRAVFESSGYIDRDMILAIGENDIEINSVRLSGGLARINLISQIKADILGIDVAVLSEFETTSAGAAMMVLTGQGVYENIRVAAGYFSAVRMIIKPDRENHKKYEYMYGLYKDTYMTLKELFRRRKKVLDNIRTEKEIQIENL